MTTDRSLPNAKRKGQRGRRKKDPRRRRTSARRPGTSPGRKTINSPIAPKRRPQQQQVRGPSPQVKAAFRCDPPPGDRTRHQRMWERRNERWRLSLNRSEELANAVGVAARAGRSGILGEEGVLGEMSLRPPEEECLWLCPHCSYTLIVFAGW